MDKTSLRPSLGDEGENCIDVHDSEHDHYVYDVVFDVGNAVVHLKYFEANSQCFTKC